MFIKIRLVFLIWLMTLCPASRPVSFGFLVAAACFRPMSGQAKGGALQHDTACGPLLHHLNQLLRCTICLMTLSPKVYVCKNGHPLCSSCLARVVRTGRKGRNAQFDPALPPLAHAACPMCRAAFSDTQRDRTLEGILPLVTLECANQPEGCLVRARANTLAQHELHECGFRAAVCGCLGYDVCAWHGLAKDVLHHVVARHSYPAVATASVVVMLPSSRYVRGFRSSHLLLRCVAFGPLAAAAMGPLLCQVYVDAGDVFVCVYHVSGERSAEVRVWVDSTRRGERRV